MITKYSNIKFRGGANASLNTRHFSIAPKRWERKVPTPPF